MNASVVSATGIHIGHDVCQRVPVLERVGSLRVRCSGATEREFREVLNQADGLVAVTLSDESAIQLQSSLIEHLKPGHHSRTFGAISVIATARE
jgi:hypothetical protein